MIFNLENLKTYEDCRDALQQILCGASAREHVSALIQKSLITERLIQTIWAQGYLKTDALETISGKKVEIINAGRWNTETGPDFLSSEIRIGDTHMKGDVEIHVHASDWARHKHDRNFEYNNCILHAFFYDDDREEYDRLFNSSPLERICLEPFIHPDIETIRLILSDDDYNYRDDAGVGRCSGTMRKLEPAFLHRLLDTAGDRRMEEKAERLNKQLAGETYDQVFYQALMTSMGYKGSRTLFFLLSKRAPIAELLDYSSGKSQEERALIIQAILLHVANLIPTGGVKTAAMDEETINYLNAINRWWAEFSGYFTDRILPPTKKWFSHVRPVNFPTRRIAGISRLLSQLIADSGYLFDKFTAHFRRGAETNPSGRILRQFLKDTERLLTVTEDPYFSFRFNFTSHRSSHPLTLIGGAQASSLMFNAVLPMLLLKARMDVDKQLEEFVWRCIFAFPPLSENVITKFMRRRLFGDEEFARPFIFNERRQQALFKIFHDCCNSNEVTCDDCFFYRQSKEQLTDEQNDSTGGLKR